MGGKRLSSDLRRKKNKNKQISNMFENLGPTQKLSGIRPGLVPGQKL